MRVLLLALVTFLLLILGSTFAVRNPQQVSIDYYFGLGYQGSLAGLILLSFSIGVTATILAIGWRVVRLRRALNKANRAISLECSEQHVRKVTDTRQR